MTFYQKVKEEFDKNNEYYLCHGSETFKKSWKVKWKRLTIARIGKKFLKVVDKMEYRNDFKTDFENGLFFPLGSDEDVKQLRIEFLNWCIQNNLDL